MPRKRRTDTRRDVADADQSLAEATVKREEQERLRAAEKTAVLARFEEIAAGNHLAEMIARAFGERHRR